MMKKWVKSIALVTTVAVGGLVACSSAHAADEKLAANDEFTTGSSDVIIKEINSQIRSTWEDNEVQPSPVADDSEWMRRVYLDVVGHIPPVEDVEKFLADKDKAPKIRPSADGDILSTVDFRPSATRDRKRS